MGNAGPRVVVVEDDSSIRSLLSELLESEGFRVFGTATGSGACSEITRELPAAILLDMRLADMKASEFLATCPGLAGGQVPIVLMSAGAEDVNIPRSAGVVAYIAKPFDLEDVLRQIRRATSLERAGT
jgi:two-component system, OmpR family, response regulator